jgi:hypothetical protein
VPITYPPRPPTPGSGGYLNDVHALLMRPEMVQRRITELASELWVADRCFVGRVQAPGSIVYLIEGPYAERPPEPVAPGAEYGRMTATVGDSHVAEVLKQGAEVEITAESIGRTLAGAREADVQFMKLVNSLVDAVDSMALIELNRVVDQETAVTVSWEDHDDSDVVGDISMARARLKALRRGYNPDTIVCDVMTEGHLLANRRIQTALAGITVNVAQQLPNGGISVLNMPVFSSVNLPDPTKVFLIDSANFGAIGYEVIPNVGTDTWTGNPATGPESRTRSDPNGSDTLLIAARRPVVAFSDHPDSAWALTGAITAAAASAPPSADEPESERKPVKK